MPGLCRGLHARRYQHHALRGHLLKTGATWRRDGSLIMDFSQECFYLATLEDASWLKETIMTRAKSGALPVPSAATSGDSVEDGRQSDSQPGGYAVEESDGASPHENESYSGGDGSYDHTVDSRIGRAAADNLGRNASVRRWGASFSTAAAGVILTQLRALLSGRQPIVWPDNNHLLSCLAGLNRDRIHTKEKSSSTRRRTQSMLR